MVIIIIGPMGSGKTTIGRILADRLSWPFFDGDDFHPRENIEKMRSGIPLNDGDRHSWLKTIKGHIDRWCSLKQDTILACSALKQSYREILGVDQRLIKTVYLKGSYELLKRRIENRSHPYMNKGLLQSQVETMEEPTEGLVVDITKEPEAIVADIIDRMDLRQGESQRDTAGEKPSLDIETSNRTAPMKRQKIGLIGLGVMGQNLALNMAGAGASVVVYNIDPAVTSSFLTQRGTDNVHGVYSPFDLAAALDKPRVVMMMVTAGSPVDEVIDRLLPFLEEGDLLLDGGNSHFRDTERRHQRLAALGINYLGVGISGGEKGALYGPCIMPGGPRQAYGLIEPLLESIAARVDGQACVTWIGPGGAGHFVKMVHNAIEYGDMQLIAESYDLLSRGLGLASDELSRVFSMWNEGPLSSYLIEITSHILTRKDEETGRPLIEMILDVAGQKGTGRWTMEAALDLGVPIPTLTAAVEARLISAYKEERCAASRVIVRPNHKYGDSHSSFIEALTDGLYLAKICAYAQGLVLLRKASETYDYRLDLSEIARIWRGGCIIRARFLDGIRLAYSECPSLPNLLMSPLFLNTILKGQESLRQVVNTAIALGIPAPALGASLFYLDSYRSALLPANLIQAQRDYFGAHTYRRIDRPGSFHTRWD